MDSYAIVYASGIWCGIWCRKSYQPSRFGASLTLKMVCWSSPRRRSSFSILWWVVSICSTSLSLRLSREGEDKQT